MIRYSMFVVLSGLAFVLSSVSSSVKVDDEFIGIHVEGFIPELINSLPEKESRGASCRIHISHEQLRAQKEIILDFHEKCDSVRIYIPPGGTVTNAGLYKDSVSRELIAETPSITLGENGNNYMTLSKELKGRFYLNYGSCHWGSEMWIVIK